MIGKRPEPIGTPSGLAGARSTQPPRDDGSQSEHLASKIEQEDEPRALDRGNPADGPMQERRKCGVAEPERPAKSSRTENTSDQQGIEIDSAIERPQEGQPGQPGGKVT